VNKRRSKKLIQKIDYFTGFAGRGTSLIDKTHCAPLTKREQAKYKKEINSIKDIKWDAFRTACIEVMGEDPECDWQ